MKTHISVAIAIAITAASAVARADNCMNIPCMNQQTCQCAGAGGTAQPNPCTGDPSVLFLEVIESPGTSGNVPLGVYDGTAGSGPSLCVEQFICKPIYKDSPDAYKFVVYNSTIDHQWNVAWSDIAGTMGNPEAGGAQVVMCQQHYGQVHYVDGVTASVNAGAGTVQRLLTTDPNAQPYLQGESGLSGIGNGYGACWWGWVPSENNGHGEYDLFAQSNPGEPTGHICYAGAILGGAPVGWNTYQAVSTPTTMSGDCGIYAMASSVVNIDGWDHPLGSPVLEPENPAVSYVWAACPK